MIAVGIPNIGRMPRHCACRSKIVIDWVVGPELGAFDLKRLIRNVATGLADFIDPGQRMIN
jgi:hypothetical protein